MERVIMAVLEDESSDPERRPAVLQIGEHSEQRNEWGLQRHEQEHENQRA